MLLGGQPILRGGGSGYINYNKQSRERGVFQNVGGNVGWISQSALFTAGLGNPAKLLTAILKYTQ